MKKHFTLVFGLLIIISCTRDQDQKRLNTFAPKVVEAKGYVVPETRIVKPKVILVDKRKLKKIPVCKPQVILTNTNVHPVGIPKIVNAGIPRVVIPGQDTFSLPQTVSAIDSPFVAGIPEVVIAKDAYTKDQNPQNFSSFSKLQGLKHSNIRRMLQDKSGNLWIGTDGGVSKYDGKSFTHYTVKEGLSNNVVWSILEDRSGNLWFGTNGGVSKYDGKSFTHYTDKEGLSNNVVWSIIEDKSGNLWFGTNDGVSKYDGKSFTHFTEKEGLCNNAVWSILEDRSGNLWFGTNNGVSRLSRDRKSFTNYTEKEGLCNNAVWSILEDRSGNLWFGTNSGISRLSRDGKSFTRYSEKEGLSNNVVYSILEDKSENLWFGTDGGVSRLSRDRKSFMNFTDKEGLSNNVVVPILEDKSGNLWFGTNGGGVSRYNGKSFTHISDQEGLSNKFVMSILEDKSGNLWFGTAGGGVSRLSRDGKSFTRYTEKEGLSNNVVYSILEDKSGNLWFGTYGGGVSRLSRDGKSFTHYTEKEGLSSNVVYSILEDKSGNLWFATAWGVSRLSRDGKSFTNYTDKEGLSNNVVWSILEDKNGNLWFGTAGGGVSRLSQDGKSFTHFTDKEGLSNNFVSSILEDKSGNLWFGTRFGLSKLARSKSAEISIKVRLNSVNETDVFFKNYTYEDGFLGIGCIRNSICEDKNGTIWIGTNDRLTAYHPPVGGEIADTLAPNIQVTSIELFSENIAWANLEKKKDSTLILGNGVRVGDFEFDGVTKWYNLPGNLSLAYNNNYLTFNFVGITLNSPKKVKYQYKLEGMDENWSAITTRTAAPYGNLPQGTYTFKVKAMNSEGYWSHEFHYTFTIRPPWWKTWWAYALYFFAITGSIWYYIKLRERALKERQKVLEKTVLERTAEVVAEKKKVEKQKERSEELLLNILPSEVAEELKQKGRAEAKQFDEVTVMFTDFKGFTQISEKLSPTELVTAIDTFFKAFDNIISKYNIEKIKTIGDSYMCAGGLPVANNTNAFDIVRAALEIQQFMLGQMQQSKKDGKEMFEVRIGVHTGPVVAGIVGLKKFAYDIWGDTVNIASRMESSGEAGKVNISGATYEIVKDKFNCTYRGKIEAKHKGEIDMYFVELRTIQFHSDNKTPPIITSLLVPEG
jgi:ligand-binding sensor domain-containing protein/class 3 adenylate cyclase